MRGYTNMKKQGNQKMIVSMVEKCCCRKMFIYYICANSPVDVESQDSDLGISSTQLDVKIGEFRSRPGVFNVSSHAEVL